MTDVEKDLFTMCGYANGLNSSNYWQARGLVGYPNSYFEPIYAEIGTGWDSGYCCSEIACCFSYIAGNLSKIFVAAWADGLVNLYRAAGRFYTNNPMPGDFIFFQYGSGTAEHTGRVAGIENGIIYTVEGNVGGGVRVLTYAVNDWTIYGYGRPDYTGQQIDTYDIRTYSPAGENLPYYNTIASGGWNSSIQGNGAISGADVLNNCVGYSQGRLIEIHNQLYPNSQITSAAGNIYSIFNANAEDWYNIAVNNGYSVGNIPAYGAVGVWYSASQQVGHVANVENYANGRWEISEGHYNYPGGQGSWDYSYLQNNTDYLPAFIGADPSWVLIGFIYPFSVPFPPPGPTPPTPPEPEEEKKMPVWMMTKKELY